MASIERSAAGSAALSPSDTRLEYIRAMKDELTGSVDSSGSAFGIQEAACSEEKAARDWTGRKEQVSRHFAVSSSPSTRLISFSGRSELSGRDMRKRRLC